VPEPRSAECGPADEALARGDWEAAREAFEQALHRAEPLPREGGERAA
jgi:hypothetical protein